MLSYSENILQALTGKSSLQNVNEDELKQVADKYPYFGAAQFLLAKKLYADKKENAEAAIQKAALHFADMLWLNYNFSEDTIVTSTTPEPSSETETIQHEEINLSKEEENKITTEEHQSIKTEENDFENLTQPVSENNIEATNDNEAINETEIEPNENLSNLLKEQVAAFEKPVEETALPIETTAHHRIDYFESQGIKLDEEKSNDKLGTQLKRFTDWLKQMKRAGPNLNNLETDAAGETHVQNMAEHSNEPKEIVTEAMAEVLIKQGKPEQAIQIYEKLSFFNPSKSAYFAAKIQELKA